MNQFTNHQTSGDDCRESGGGETSREQFEAWFQIHWIGKVSSMSMFERHRLRNIAWSAWQASRGAIEISLPPRVITAEIGPAVSLEKMTARLAVNGIKVKSDEQRNPTPS
ncbi:hypothetical protein K5Y32_07275 [Pantoea sp. DY-15]|uniref:hypothetical protein n=1 Tax=Pantoea sp. DY-15 TaxID=2871489 RepID=UPI001C983C78|nr:hypothetical protein [Pantoea sp. DY-15]MBY4887733.1 hypothetical protein [Pantoea sp. DY-15]